MNIYNRLLSISDHNLLYDEKVNIITKHKVDLTHYIFTELNKDKKKKLLKHFNSIFYDFNVLSCKLKDLSEGLGDYIDKYFYI